MRVLVCDDLTDRCDETVSAIHEAGQRDLVVDSLVGGKLTAELISLFGYVGAYLNEGARPASTIQTAFDAVDLIIIDNSLAQLDIKGSRLTAEDVAGFIRTFTAAPYIVSLNKNSTVDFDLRYLIGDYATRTDLALNNRHLANPSLWTGNTDDAIGEFSPWYWPTLTKAPEGRRVQIDFVKKNLDRPVLEAFDFDEEAIEFLSRHAKGALSPIARSTPDSDGDAPLIREVTFRQVFLSSPRSIPDRAERDRLDKGQREGGAEFLEFMARVVAADIDRWLRLDVLGPQEALVDVPHLLMRMPFLLGDKASDSSAWNAAVTAKAAPFGMDQAIFDRFVAANQFRQDDWVLHPSFWWSKLRGSEELNRLFLSPRVQWADVVFCEDFSKFKERKAIEGSEPREFVAEFEGPWDRRHVAYSNDFKYVPRSRFAL